MQLDNIHVVLRADGRMTGEAFVSFANAKEARSAQKAKDRCMLGSRYIELLKTTPEELARSMIGQQYHQQQEQEQEQQQGATAAGNSGSSVGASISSITSSETNDTTTSSSSAGNLNNNGAFLKEEDDEDLDSTVADVATLSV